jgi:hypothetical protein
MLRLRQDRGLIRWRVLDNVRSSVAVLVTATAHAETVTVTGADGATGMPGFDAVANAGPGPGPDPTNTANAYGGTGGSPFGLSAGGDGGRAISTATTSIATGAASANSTASGGNGGSDFSGISFGPAGNGGSATSAAIASTASGAASANSTASGGNDGSNGGGNESIPVGGNMGGSATALASAFERLSHRKIAGENRRVLSHERIAEPHAAVRFHHDIIRRVEPLVFELRRQGDDASVMLGAGDPSAPVLATDQTAFEIDGVPVGITRRLAEYRNRAARLVIAHDPVVRDVGENEIAPGWEIGRPLDPARAGPQALELRGADDELAKARIKNFKLTHAHPLCSAALPAHPTNEDGLTPPM